MLLPAKRAGFIQRHFRIQRFIAGIIDHNTPVFQDTEICTFKHLVLIWTDKTEFHIFAPYSFGPMNQNKVIFVVRF